MVEVGVRELKSRLSYYVQLMQTGEEIAVKVRNHIVGFLTNKPSFSSDAKTKKSSKRSLLKRIETLKREGFLCGGGLYHYRPPKRVSLKNGPSSTELIRDMRNEE